MKWSFMINVNQKQGICIVWYVLHQKSENSRSVIAFTLIRIAKNYINLEFHSDLTYLMSRQIMFIEILTVNALYTLQN
jgi:hypothetical protein